MNKASLFDVARGILWGCGVTILVLMLLEVVDLVLFEVVVELAFGPILFLNLHAYYWSIAVGVGGYWACRQAKAIGWINCLVFAVVAEIFVFLEVPASNKLISEIFADPAALRWPFLPMLMLTLPAALLGGYLWTRSNKDRDGHTKHVGNTLDA